MTVDGAFSAVVNGSMFNGYGKLISRFLHLFDDKVTDSLRFKNKPITNDVVCVENTDASFFNANIHPVLMDNEIKVPGGHNSIQNEKLILVSDVQVRYDSEFDELFLFYNKTGKRVFIFDLGFQGHLGRSPLFRLLDLFSPSHPSPFEVITMAVNEAYRRSIILESSSNKFVQISPRIVVDQVLILQRKKWTFHRSLFPRYSKGSCESDIYLIMMEWKNEHCLPDEVFIRLPNTEHEVYNDKSRKVLKRDDLKPQYINFKIPMLMSLLQRVLEKADAYLIVEEMLPGDRGMITLNDESYITELLVQWYE